MARRRSFDEITFSIEHARPVHPLRVLIENRFYIDSWVSSERGLALMMFNALLFVPFMMALFFYPIPTLITAGAVIVASLVVWEGIVLWRRRHPRGSSPSA
jgi:hypothetical protein